MPEIKNKNKKTLGISFLQKNPGSLKGEKTKIVLFNG